MKLLGSEIASHISDLTSYKNFCEYAACLERDDDLLAILRRDIEQSALFDDVGIKGFVEEAIFSWYLDTSEINRPPVTKALRSLLVRISMYRMDLLTEAKATDVLKSLYQSLVPDTLRKSLGEFYTPDWLVDYTLDIAESGDSWVSVRALDPTCGSGSFLIQLINRKRQEMEYAKIHPEEIVSHLVSHVWGFDLNPLAVQAARVNFLISIADLLEQCGAMEIELPVLLADSVYSPAENPETKDGSVTYKIGSNIANLEVILPSALAFDRTKLDSVFQFMGDMVEENKEFCEVRKKLISRNILTDFEVEKWDGELEQTYCRVLDLHRKNWNGIWFRIVRNFFWSATAGHFDLVVGNPPWVRWSNLPEKYRERIMPTCQEYEIFSDSPYHGGNELDISGMITYTVADKWLKENGCLVFVITQTHFQSPSSQGFRSFRIDDKYFLVPTRIDDLKALKPFASAANKTAIAKFRKQPKIENLYPLPYFVWKNKDDSTKKLPETLPKDLILARTERIEMEANPVGDVRSPWAIMMPGLFEEADLIRCPSFWIKGRKGVCADLNGVYIVNIVNVDKKRNMVQIETRPNAGKIDIGPAKSFWVEPDLLYPVIKGAGDFSNCWFEPQSDLYMFVPNAGIRKDDLLMMEDCMSSLPKTEKYFKSFHSQLLRRSTYKARLSKYAYYAVYNVGAYSFASYKVIWAEQSGVFKSAVAGRKMNSLVGNKPYIPDHKIYFVDFQDKDPAYFLCGLLNCSLVKNYIESHTISIQVSNIFKHLDLPKYNENDYMMSMLAGRTEEIHSIVDADERIVLLKEIDELAYEIIKKPK